LPELSSWVNKYPGNHTCFKDLGAKTSLRDEASLAVGVIGGAKGKIASMGKGGSVPNRESHRCIGPKDLGKGQK
jgi:hypothetical protein